MGYLALGLLLIGGLGLVIARRVRYASVQNGRIVQLLLVAVLGIGVILSVFTTFYIVNPGEVAVEVLFGNIQGYRENGFHAKLPIADVHVFDIKTQKSHQECEAASSDLQIVKVVAVINYRLDSTKIAHLYQQVGRDYESKVVLPMIQECVKAGVSQYKVEDIIIKRMELKATIENLLKDRFTAYFITMEGVNLQNIDFSAEFNKVVELKQIAEQQIKTAEFNRQKAEKEKQTTILQAQAEAEKQRLLSVSTSKDVADLKWIEKWNGILPQMMGGNAMIPMVNFGK